MESYQNQYIDFFYLFIYFTTTLLTKVIQCIKDEFGLSVWIKVEEELNSGQNSPASPSPNSPLKQRYLKWVNTS